MYRLAFVHFAHAARADLRGHFVDAEARTGAEGQTRVVDYTGAAAARTGLLLSDDMTLSGVTRTVRGLRITSGRSKNWSVCWTDVARSLRKNLLRIGDPRLEVKVQGRRPPNRTARVKGDHLLRAAASRGRDCLADVDSCF